MYSIIGLLLNSECRYGNNSGTTNLMRHIDSDHLALLNQVKQRIVGNSEDTASSNSTTRHPKRCRSPNQMVQNSGVKSRKKATKQSQFQKKLVSCIAGCHLPLSIVEAREFKDLMHFFDPSLAMPSRRSLTDSVIPNQVEEMKLTSIYPLLSVCQSGCLLYDIWMSRRTVDIVGLIFSMVTPDFRIQEICLGLLEVSSTVGTSLAVDIKQRLVDYKIDSKLFGVVRDGGSNLRVAANELSQLNLPLQNQPLFETVCLAHQISSACSAVSKTDQLISSAKTAMSKVVTWTRKVRSFLFCYQTQLPDIGWKKHKDASTCATSNQHETSKTCQICPDTLRKHSCNVQMLVGE